MGRFILPLGLALVTAVTLAPTTVRANNREIAPPDRQCDESDGCHE